MSSIHVCQLDIEFRVAWGMLRCTRMNSLKLPCLITSPSRRQQGTQLAWRRLRVVRGSYYVRFQHLKIETATKERVIWVLRQATRQRSCENPQTWPTRGKEFRAQVWMNATAPPRGRLH